MDLAFGDVDATFATADLLIDGDFFFEGTTHAAIEPHCALATVDGGSVLTVWSTAQVPHYLHRELARVLELPARRNCARWARSAGTSASTRAAAT